LSWIKRDRTFFPCPRFQAALYFLKAIGGISLLRRNEGKMKKITITFGAIIIVGGLLLSNQGFSQQSTTNPLNEQRKRKPPSEAEINKAFPTTQTPKPSGQQPGKPAPVSQEIPVGQSGPFGPSEKPGEPKGIKKPTGPQEIPVSSPDDGGKKPRAPQRPHGGAIR
jgi:hypothetical protein